MKSYPYIPTKFDGSKFEKRYGISGLNGDFWADSKFIYIRDGLVLPDDPPVFEAPDSLINPNATLIMNIDILLSMQPATLPQFTTAIKAIMAEWRKKL